MTIRSWTGSSWIEMDAIHCFPCILLYCCNKSSKMKIYKKNLQGLHTAALCCSGGRSWHCECFAWGTWYCLSLVLPFTVSIFHCSNFLRMLSWYYGMPSLVLLVQDRLLCDLTRNLLWINESSVVDCGTLTIFYGSGSGSDFWKGMFLFRFRLLKSYGSGSYFWQVTVPVWKIFAFLHSKLFYKKKKIINFNKFIVKCELWVIVSSYAFF